MKLFRILSILLVAFSIFAMSSCGDDNEYITKTPQGETVAEQLCWLHEEFGYVRVEDDGHGKERFLEHFAFAEKLPELSENIGQEQALGMGGDILQDLAKWYKAYYCFLDEEGNESCFFELTDEGASAMASWNPGTEEQMINATGIYKNCFLGGCKLSSSIIIKYLSGKDPVQVVCNSEEGSQGLEYRLSGNGEFYTLTGMGTCKDRELVIPGKYKGKPVRVIEEFAFSGNMNITRVDISDSVEVIKAGAFSGCDNIFTITLGEGLCDVSGLGRSMRIQEVFNRSRLDEETLRTSGFGEMISTYETSRVEITKDDFAFYVDGDNISLIGYVGDKKDIVLPNNYKGKSYMIGSNAFHRGEFDSVVLSEGITEIRRNAFWMCSGLNNLVIPNGVKKIETGAFNMADIESVTISNTVEIIEEAGFFCEGVFVFYCEAPSKPQGWHDKWSYEKRKTVVWNYKNNDVAEDGYIHITHDGIEYGIANGEATVLSAKNDDENANILENISFKDKSYFVTSINRGGFSSKRNLKSVVIPSTVTSIGEGAFSGCESLKSIIIPSGVVSMGQAVFSGCRQLTIYCEAPSKPQGWHESWDGRCEVEWGYTE